MSGRGANNLLRILTYYFGYGLTTARQLIRLTFMASQLHSALLGDQAEVIADAQDSQRLGYWRDRVGAKRIRQLRRQFAITI